MEKIDIKQFQPRYIDENGIETWDTAQARLKMVAEKLNEIIEVINNLEVHRNTK